MLADVVRVRPGTRLGAGERHALALTQGLAHGAAHSFFFYFRSCRCMSSANTDESMDVVPHHTLGRRLTASSQSREAG